MLLTIVVAGDIYGPGVESELPKMACEDEPSRLMASNVLSVAGAISAKSGP